MAELPSVNDMWLKARERYETDAEFHALVYSTAELLRMPVEYVTLPVHAMQLAAELLSLSQDMQQGLASGAGVRVIDGDAKLDLFEVSLVEHRMGPRCAVLGPTRLTCPGCGVGYVDVRPGG